MGGRKGKSKDGGQAVIEKGQIVIRVAVDALQHIIDGAYAMNGPSRHWKVTDCKTFAREICRAINDEDETGETPFHRMFDAAMEHAIDQGAEGVEEHPEQES